MADPMHLQRLAAQCLNTDRLFGVEFVTRRDAESLIAAVGAAHGAHEPGARVDHDSAHRGSARPVAAQRAAPIEASAQPALQPASQPEGAPTSTRSADGASATVVRSVGRSSDGSSGPKAQRLAALRVRHDGECPHCTVATAHTQTVFGDGNPDAELMFVGEAPGETEDRLGRPFVGRAGQKLDEIIAAMGLARESVYIANVLKSRPPDNRTPLRHEVEACGPYLAEQIRIIEPKVIVTLGGPATKLLLGIETGITRLRGVWAQYADGDVSIDVMPTFHPAYLLRNYTPQTRKQVWSDMLEVCVRLGLRAR